MKGGTVQINWHDTKPVLTLDFHPFSNLLATGGADFDIKLWLLNSGEGQKNVPNASYQSSLSYHGSAINCLRFSPSGEQLASGADGGELIIWKLHHLENGQTWKVLKTLSFHRKDVLDLQWSNDGAYLISGSVDNSCLIWDVSKGSVHQILDAHLHYVQGVALDPLGKYAASLSSDRSCRIYVNKPPTKIKSIEKMNYVCQHVITKAEHLSIDSKSARNHFFHDETLPSFFRRLAWSPDGSFLLVPAGICKMSPASEPINTAYIFSRKDLSRPAVRLPSASKPVVAVRFCPKLFSLRGLNPAGFFKLPYRIIFAVVTLNSLYIYDTESAPPLAIMAGLHYAAITDVAWSADAHYLALSSQDGYCTLVEFENDELGSPYAQSEDKICTIDGKISSSQKPDDLTSEAIRSDDQNRKQESESVEQPSPIQKLDDLTGEVIGSDDQNRKTEVEGNEVKQEESKSVKKSCSIQKLDDLIGEAIGSDDQNRKTEVEGNEVKQEESKSVEKLNSIQKLDDLTGEAIGSDDQNRKREARAEENEVKQEESKRVNNMVIEEASSGDNVVALDSRGNEMEKNASKQASLSSSRSDHVSSKPAKRRITPVAIDP